MKKYIDKAALVAEIEKLEESLKADCKPDLFGNVEECMTAAELQALDVAKEIINTLEVKETGTENHINCKIGWYDGMFLDYTQEQLSTLLDKIGANVGDEVKIYITK